MRVSRVHLQPATLIVGGPWLGWDRGGWRWRLLLPHVSSSVPETLPPSLSVVLLLRDRCPGFCLCSKEVLTLGPVLGSSSVTYSACLRFSRALCYTARSFPPALRCIYHLQLIRAPRDLSAFLRFSIPSYTTRRSRRRPCLLIPPRIIDLPKTTTPYIPRSLYVVCFEYSVCDLFRTSVS
mgnify:CR=1 FL=1